MLNLSNFDSAQDQQAYMGGDGEKNQDFRLTVDFVEYHRTSMAAKGTGFENETKQPKKIKKKLPLSIAAAPKPKAIPQKTTFESNDIVCLDIHQIKQIVKNEKKSQLKSLTDSGLNDNILKR